MIVEKPRAWALVFFATVELASRLSPAQAIPSPAPVVWPKSGGSLSVFSNPPGVFKGQLTPPTATTQGTLNGNLAVILNSANVTFGPYAISLRNTGMAPFQAGSVSHTFTISVWGSSPGQVAGSSPLSFVKLGQASKTLTAGLGLTVSSSLSVSVVMPSVFTDIKVIANFSPGPFGRPDAASFPTSIVFPSANCGLSTPGLTASNDACAQAAINPTGLLVPDLMPVTIIYEPPGNCSYSNLTFTSSVGSSMALTQANSNATNNLWNYSAAGGLFMGSSNTTQTIVNASTSTSSFTSTTVQAFGTPFGLPLQSPGNGSCKAGQPAGDVSATDGPGIGDQVVFAVQPTFLYWDTAGLTSFRISTQQAPNTQETVGAAYIRQIDPARPSLRPSFMASMSPAQLQAIRSLDVFAPSTNGSAPTPKDSQPQACSSGGFLSPSRYIYLGRRCLAAGNATQVIQGTTFDATTQTAINNGFQTINTTDNDPGAKNLQMIIGGAAGLLTLASGDGLLKAFDTFGKASDGFDKFVLHDTNTTTVTENITTNKALTNSGMSSYAETFFVDDQNAEIDTDLYYDSFFGTIAFNRIASCNAPRVGKSCNHQARNVYTPGDFDGDGKTDLIITNSSGSYWYFSNGDGTWRYPYTRTDWTLGSVQFVTGDFDGNGKTDFIAVTPTGSTWYFSNGDGTWTTPYVRTDLTLGSVSYTTGYFNNDAYTDLVITNASGSYWYLSHGDGMTWSIPYIRTDLPLGVAQYVAGDFNGDRYTDLIITTPNGSYWYYSQGDGSWISPYSRSDLPLGTPSFTVADFNGDHKMDMIINTPTGSTWLFSTGTGTWTQAYSRWELTTGNTTYTPGDFNGDGYDDLVITTPDGSYWYFSNGDGSWTFPYTRNDLPLGTVQYLPAKFNNDPKADLLISNFTGSYWYFSNGDGTWTTPYYRTDLLY